VIKGFSVGMAEHTCCCTLNAPVIKDIFDREGMMQKFLSEC
jgi:hypothetical protein